MPIRIDVCVLRSAPASRYLLEAAYIAIEVLSEDDSMTKTMEKLADYEAAGVAHIWLVDPRLEQMSVYSTGNLTRVEVLSTPDGVEITRNDVFGAK